MIAELDAAVVVNTSGFKKFDAMQFSKHTKF